MQTVTAKAFGSILSPDGADVSHPTTSELLHDLALEQVLVRLTPSPAAAAAFRTLCADEDGIRYRQDVFRTLEDTEQRTAVDQFLAAMTYVDRCDDASSRAHYPFEGELWHLHAVVRYGEAVDRLGAWLHTHPSDADGIRLLGQYIDEYTSSSGYRRIVRTAGSVSSAIEGISYDILVRGARVTVSAFDDEPDLRRSVLATFERFANEGSPLPRPSIPDAPLDQVQAWVLERVAQVHPSAFAALVSFAAETVDYRDPTLVRFAGEVTFYLGYLDHIAPLRKAGLPFSYPVVSASSKELDVTDAFDLALATRLVAEGAAVIGNGLRLSGRERILVISGPNQGGKTTMARTFGQLHHLAGIGCPVPGRAPHVFLCDRVVALFEREEKLDELEGRLGAEIQRTHDMFAQATPRTVFVLNEVFSSTALEDARTLTRDVLDRILALDALAVCVTFIDEMSRIDERTVSMVSTVDPDDAAIRTFRVERRTADGRAYARALADRHGLTEERIRARMADKEKDR